MGTEGAGELELLVVAGERSFGRAVVDALEAARTGVTATLLGPGADPVDRATASEADGLVVGSGVETPVAVVRRSTDEPGQPVVLLANAGDESTVDDALAAGAADVSRRQRPSASVRASSTASRRSPRTVRTRPTMRAAARRRTGRLPTGRRATRSRTSGRIARCSRTSRTDWSSTSPTRARFST
jgi:hypothetical protein